MGNALLIAAGGGGDAISAAALGPILGLTGERPTVMTYAWDRLLIDPLPGPRSAEDFAGLAELAPNVLQITPDTRTIPPAGSTLPRLAAELPARLLLLDPAGGAVGMSEQIVAAAEYVGADSVAVVDVGGDAMTDGHDEGLRSPLADLLVMAAASLTTLSAQLVIPGPGIDGELSPGTVLERIEYLGGGEVARLSADSMRNLAPLFDWHPSEASGLLALASRGGRGIVEVRDEGSAIDITDESATIYSLDLERVVRSSPASRLRTTSSLHEAAEACYRQTGVSELEYEVRKAQTARSVVSRKPVASDLKDIDRQANDARARGTSYITLRRLAELVGVKNASHLADLRIMLKAYRSEQYEPPVFATLQREAGAESN